MGRLMVFVEDPGAANFIAPVLDGLARVGWDLELVATGAARDFFTDRDITASDAANDMDAASFLKQSGADLLMVGTSENPDTLAFPLVAAARKAGTPSIGFVDGPANAGQRFRGHDSAALAHVPEWLLVTDEATADRFIQLDHPADRLVVTGHPYYDLVLAEAADLRSRPTAEHRRLTLGDAPVDRKVIVFLGEGSDGLGLDLKRRNAGYTLDGWGECDRRTEIVLEEFLDAVDKLPNRPHLVFRAHPKDPPSNYAGYLDRFDAISEGGRPLQLLFGADLVVGLSTSLLVEAALAGLKTLSILPSETQKDLVPTIASGLTSCATDRGTLHRLLPDLLQSHAARAPDATPVGEAGAVTRVLEAIDHIAVTARTN